MKKVLLSFSATKEGESLFLQVKANKELEKLFEKTANGETRKSVRWVDEVGVGLDFYVGNEQTEKMLNSLNSCQNVYFENFGSGLKEERGRINVAILRAKGISKGLKLNTTELLTYDELTDYIKKLAEFSKELYKKNNWLIWHARFATTGEKDYQNIHLWDVNGWHFAHNGTVPRFASAYSCYSAGYNYKKKYEQNNQTPEQTDSLRYFNLLMSKMAENETENQKIVTAINKTNNDSSFNGRAILLPPQKLTNALYLFGDFEVVFLDDCLIISSADFPLATKQDLFGLTLEIEATDVITTTIEGIFLFDFEQMTFNKLATPATKYNQTTPYCGRGTFQFDNEDSFEDEIEQYYKKQQKHKHMGFR